MTCGAQPDVDTNVVRAQVPHSPLAATSQMLRTAAPAPIMKHFDFRDVVDSMLANALNVSRCFFCERGCGAQPDHRGVKLYVCRTGEDPTWTGGANLSIFCMALFVHPKHHLPTEDFQGLEELVNFERACECECVPVCGYRLYY